MSQTRRSKVQQRALQGSVKKEADSPVPGPSTGWQGSMTSTDGQRRSSRHRVPSTRLQDMEVNITGSSKKGTKRLREADEDTGHIPKPKNILTTPNPKSVSKRLFRDTPEKKDKRVHENNEECAMPIIIDPLSISSTSLVHGENKKQKNKILTSERHMILETDKTKIKQEEKEDDQKEDAEEEEEEQIEDRVEAESPNNSTKDSEPQFEEAEISIQKENDENIENKGKQIVKIKTEVIASPERKNTEKMADVRTVTSDTDAVKHRDNVDDTSKQSTSEEENKAPDSEKEVNGEKDDSMTSKLNQDSGKNEIGVEVTEDLNVKVVGEDISDKAGAHTVVVVSEDGRELVLCLDEQNMSLSDLEGADIITLDEKTLDPKALEPKNLPTAAMVDLRPTGAPSVKFVTVNTPTSPPDTLATNPTGSEKPVHMVIAGQHKPMGGEGEGEEWALVTETFLCSQCDYKTDKKVNFYKHKRKHTGGKLYPCSMCAYKASSSSNLKRHMGTHNDIRTYKCEICEKMFRQKIHLERHVRYKHQEKRIKCPHCDYCCANENPDLKMHIKRKHLAEEDEEEARKSFCCGDCGFVAKSKRDLLQHMKFHRSGPELKLYCEQCSFVTDCESRLERHVRTHSKEKPFQCGYCEYKGTQKSHVLRHMQAVHNVEIPQGRKYARRKSDVVEMLVHTPTGFIKKKKIYPPADFSKHEKVFSCAHCTMRFAKLINLYKHLKVQHKESHMPNSEGMHSCVICEYRTTKKKNLLIHMRKHNIRENESDPSQVYTCVFCNFSHSKRKNLYSHMRKKHKMHIIIKEDGSASCVIDNELNPASGEVEQQTVELGNDIANEGIVQPASSLVGTNLTIPNPPGMPGVAKGQVPGTQTVMVELEPGMPATAVEIDIPTHPQSTVASLLGGATMDTEAADAIQGLQALAEQKVLLPPPTSKVIVKEQPTVATPTVATPPQQTPAEGETSQENIHLSEEQLMQLSSGDFIEINGEMYKVEFSE